MKPPLPANSAQPQDIETDAFGSGIFKSSPSGFVIILSSPHALHCGFTAFAPITMEQVVTGARVGA
jgi:hypothetical protein